MLRKKQRRKFAAIKRGILKIENYTDTIHGDTIVSDSISCLVDIANDEPYRDFKFVAETSTSYEGPVERDVTSIGSGWNFMILLFAMILMVANKFFAPQRFSAIITLPFQGGVGEKMIRESNLFFNIISLSILASFVLLFSILIQKFYLIYGGNYILHDNMNFFWDITIVVVTTLVLNYLLTLLYSWLFKAEEILLLLHVSLTISAMALAVIVLIPSVLLLLFYPYKFVFIITVSLLSVISLARFIKLLIEVRMLSKLNFVNIFLYLCAVEILPILMMSKMILMAI